MSIHSKGLEKRPTPNKPISGSVLLWSPQVLNFTSLSIFLPGCTVSPVSETVPDMGVQLLFNI